MLRFFQKEAPRTFSPPPKPPPPRELPNRPPHPQEQSPFFSKLPPELRNQIYFYVFSDTTPITARNPISALRLEGARPTDHPVPDTNRTSQDRISGSETKSACPNTPPTLQKEEPGKPLDLLLTCLKLSQEATHLAFSLHPFLLSPSSRTTPTFTFFSLHYRSSILPASLSAALRVLAYDLGPSYAHNSRSISEFVSNAMVLFPLLRKCEIRVQEGRVRAELQHGKDRDSIALSYKSVMEEVVGKFVPRWLYVAVQDVVAGRRYAWQKGEGWGVEWPIVSALMEAGVYGEDVRWEADWRSQLVWQEGEGVGRCACGCGDVVWLRCFLVQEGGRRVEVEAVFHARSEVAREREERMLSVRLKELQEGIQRLPVVQGNGGVGWEADEEYWDGLRKRNRGWLVSKLDGVAHMVKGGITRSTVSASDGT
ncbi:hypothetical protein BDV96DRAFT_651639 [Lophiotrema nucula]|uniref:DUF7730 domain-containing protein n=1 Tax=Lophiotrema nucula TaxID=690887 RepID=A0A6A5YU49_9PLEO|nr:hypothetical protein BDV96DRAFT_651639 [Lophiotrema nucula]